ncbi:peptidase M28-like protein [Algoriphagus ratkowskyi]|uniref:M20/M25/M40 family metallo-hydrolase n=1 Tax=Algoriphagus ratkowskyi TaxID=57028 RepID=A0A2W7RSV2_9BACT|nr:M20/M25/M40 family metallo-hydrolase [Algoriphagus ratkowskyi]PZX53935.1 peptidase M28-like protein [Algoriphagus ratkowskyi]TXD76665.1 M20/M25/M40 family metallo-hydrolase [Algoriphagus ratkowskyi]
MHKSLLILFLVLGSQVTMSQTTVIRNPEIAQMVSEISSDSLEHHVRRLASFNSRHTLNTNAENGMPAAQQYVLSKFNNFAKQSNGRMTAEIEKFTIPGDKRRVLVDSPGANVFATLKGTDPADDRIFVISGHMDSRNKDIMDVEGSSPGANDDGSGTAAVIELARVMASHKFSATILFVAFTGEEQGLKGATYMSDKAKAEDWNIAAVLNNDIVGNSNSSETLIKDNLKMRVFSETIPMAETEQQATIRRSINADNDSESRQLARYIKELGERYVDQFEVKLIYRSDRFLRGGDQTAFARNAFTAVRMSEMNENFLHQHENVRVEDGVQYGDLPEFMDFEYLRKVAAVNLASLASLANSPDQPQEVKIDVRGLSNKSTLLWKASVIGKTKGYYVLMRETSSAVWERKFWTTDTTLTLPYSKDNYFFAVQSVSESGAESLPVIPSPLSR